MRNFLRLIEQDNPETAITRMISNDEELRVNLKRCGSHVQLKLAPLMNIMSKSPLAPFIKLEDAEKVENLKIPDIYPFLSTANFDEQNIYRTEDYFGNYLIKKLYSYIINSFIANLCNFPFSCEIK